MSDEAMEREWSRGIQLRAEAAFSSRRMKWNGSWGWTVDLARSLWKEARFLLCGPKDAEIARLKAELDGARNELALVRQDFARASTAAENARREALEEAYQLAAAYLVARRPEIELFVAKLRELRDVSQPVAETRKPTCSDPGCGQCACQSSRVQTVAEAQTPARDVEGLAEVDELARVLRRRWFPGCVTWSHAQEQDKDKWRDIASAAIAFMDGGPRT